MVNSMSTFTDKQGQSSPVSPTVGYNAEQPQQQQDTMLKGNYCAIYEATAPRGCKFKIFNGPGKKDRESDGLVAKLNELKLNSEKNAVAKLNEMMLLLKKKNVVYEMVDIGGFVHSPIFTIRAQSEDISVFGTGTSKKEAKRQAAIAFIERMDFNNGNDDITSTTSNSINIPIEEKFSEQGLVDLKSEINPIGLLQEVCMNYHWQLPTYEYITATLTTNRSNKGYIAFCLLYMYKTSAVQRTKQSAKREAARLMYDKIKKLSPDEIRNLSLHVYPTPSSVMLHNNTPVKKNNELELLSTPENLKTIERFYTKLRMSNNPAVNKLKSLNFTKFPGNAVEILDQIGEEEGFTSTYVLLSNPSSSKIGILVQVSVTPLIVHVGTGKTKTEAQEAAANVALIYLKLFLD